MEPALELRPSLWDIDTAQLYFPAPFEQKSSLTVVRYCTVTMKETPKGTAGLLGNQCLHWCGTFSSFRLVATTDVKHLQAIGPHGGHRSYVGGHWKSWLSSGPRKPAPWTNPATCQPLLLLLECPSKPFSKNATASLSLFLELSQQIAARPHSAYNYCGHWL